MDVIFIVILHQLLIFQMFIENQKPIKDPNTQKLFSFLTKHLLNDQALSTSIIMFLI